PPTGRPRGRRPGGPGTRSWPRPASRRPRTRRRRARRDRAHASRNPPEPERREGTAKEQEGGRAAGEQVGDLPRLAPVPEPGAELLVDLSQPAVARRREELAAGLPRHSSERVRIRRDADRRLQAAGDPDVDDASLGPDENRVDRDVVR